MDWLFNILPGLIISLISLAISIKSWHRSRVFYDIEVFELHHTKMFGLENKEIRDKLNTGKYTILNTYTDQDPLLALNPIWGSQGGEGFVSKKEKIFIILGKIRQ